MLITVARRAHVAVTALFAGCVVVQVFLAGLGVFDDPGAFITHREFGYLFGWLTLVALVLALVGRMPRRAVGLSVLLLVLFALQSVFVALRSDLPAVAALHPLNGFAILGVAIVTAQLSWETRRRPATVEAVRMAAPAASPSEAG
jgi:mercuric ion transport protein